MKTAMTRFLILLLLMGQSFITFGQILTSELNVRTGSTIIQDATTIEGTVTVDQPVVPNDGNNGSKAHLILTGSSNSPSDRVGLKFFQNFAPGPFSGQLRFDAEGFHFTNGHNQEYRSIFAKYVYATHELRGNSIVGSSFTNESGGAANFPAGLTSNTLSGTTISGSTISGGSFTNESGGAANFPSGLISDKVEGKVLEWTNFSANVTQPIFTSVPQGIYLLTIRGRGLYHAYATFIIHCYDGGHKNATRLVSTGYQSEWTIGWNDIVWVGNNNFTINAKVNQGQQGRFSLLRLN